MLGSLSTNVLSSQLRATTSEGISSFYQREIDSVTYSEQSREKTAELSNEKVQEFVDGLNSFMQPANTSIHFEFHEKLNEYFVRLVDNVTDEIIREIPSKKLLDYYAAMTEFMGIIIDKKI